MSDCETCLWGITLEKDLRKAVARVAELEAERHATKPLGPAGERLLARVAELQAMLEKDGETYYEACTLRARVKELRRASGNVLGAWLKSDDGLPANFGELMTELSRVLAAAPDSVGADSYEAVKHEVRAAIARGEPCPVCKDPTCLTHRLNDGIAERQRPSEAMPPAPKHCPKCRADLEYEGKNRWRCYNVECDFIEMRAAPPPRVAAPRPNEATKEEENEHVEENQAEASTKTQAESGRRRPGAVPGVPNLSDLPDVRVAPPPRTTEATPAPLQVTDEDRDCTCPSVWYSSTHAPECAVVYARNPKVPRYCDACGSKLRLENLFVDDGCPCNSPRGVNFTPQHCALCKTDNCVKPGHRIESLFGINPCPDYARDSGTGTGAEYGPDGSERYVEPASVESDGTRVHHLKCWPIPYADMAAGRKPFEYRKWDRDYRVGDVLLLNEYNPETKNRGGVLWRQITYLLPGGTFGVPLGYCVLGVAPPQRSETALVRCCDSASSACCECRAAGAKQAVEECWQRIESYCGDSPWKSDLKRRVFGPVLTGSTGT